MTYESDWRHVFKNKKWSNEIIKFHSDYLQISEKYFRNFKAEGYELFYWKNQDNKTTLKITLKYFEGDPVIKEIKEYQNQGRVYSRATSIPKVMNGLGLAILSTPKGVMSDTEARKNNVGGEIICRVF